MVRFVIVEDEIEEINHIKSLLDDVVKQDKEVLCFSKIDNELKKEIQNTDVRKVYILDIELGNKVSGISIAKHIRDVDWESEIIFITNHDKMFESAHRTVYKVFDFIEKFHEFDKRLKTDIKAILKANFDNKMFIYKVNNVELSVYYKSILYIFRDTEDRKLIIVTDSKNNNTYKVSLTIKEILPLLDSRFVQCHRSCIVNKTRVHKKNYKDGYFVLDNGEKVYMLSGMNKKELELV
ncbi:MAG: LytTR family transcriptional regulator DNA-binding domain-containing protein [Bacilli bacterium]|nr:LytTR family transcriptional regulator DNA-binding domain-containing protein [Bacilli bacterium]